MSLSGRGIWGLFVPLLAAFGCGADPIGVSDPALGGPQTSISPPPPPSQGPALRLTVRSSDDLLPMPVRVLFDAADPKVKLDFRSDGNKMAELTSGVFGVPEGVMLPYGKGLVPVP